MRQTCQPYPNSQPTSFYFPTFSTAVKLPFWYLLICRCVTAWLGINLSSNKYSHWDISSRLLLCDVNSPPVQNIGIWLPALAHILLTLDMQKHAENFTPNGRYATHDPTYRGTKWDSQGIFHLFCSISYVTQTMTRCGALTGKFVVWCQQLEPQ